MTLDEIIRGTIAAHKIKSDGDTEYILRKLIESALVTLALKIGYPDNSPRPNWRDCDERYD
jgi:hypothetical protein